MRAVHIASQVRSDARAIAKLDLRPVLTLDTQFKEAKNTSPHFTVTNDGPVEAVQLVIQLISHRYFGEDRDLQLSTSGSMERRTLAKLPPLSRVSFQLSDHWLNVSARLGEPPEYNIMEIRLKYRRQSDMRLFVESGFYFINPDGEWVEENHSSLTPEIYDPIRKAAVRFAGRLSLKHFTQSSDKLHPIEPEE